MKVAREGNDALVSLAMKGEGETWDQVLRLSLTESEGILRLQTSDGTKPKVVDPLPKTRCTGDGQ